MSEFGKGFYVIGGSLRSDTLSYIKRQADADLYDALMQGEFCYILTARQMGKSSLMARTTARLREEAVRVIILDLTAVGQNLTVDQWYFNLLGLMGEQLDLEAELQEYWAANDRMGPMRRFMGSLSAIVLPNCAGRIVVFIDEIDVVRSLPFSTDELFAAIREFYNRRSEDAEFNRLTFCMLGVATPNDLIRDIRTTPFNIGRRIDLTDFTANQAAPLREGLRLANGASTEHRDFLMERVLYWTGGHPYLTQRLLEGVRVKIGNCRSIDICCKLVDSVSEALFLSPGARDRDDNLLFVRERLLRSEVDLVALLTLYATVWRSRQRPRADQANPLVSVLLLSGVTRESEGKLHIRNRIYHRVFDLIWTARNFPDAEVRRQRAAYRRGVLRSAFVATGIFAAMSILVFIAVSNARSRNAEARRSQQIARDLRRNLYAADLSSAQAALDEDNTELARALLEPYRPKIGMEDLRTFEWNYLWGMCRDRSVWTFTVPNGSGRVALSPVGQTLAIGGINGKVRLYDMITHRELEGLPQLFKCFAWSLAYSPDGHTLAVQGSDDGGPIIIWDVVHRLKKGRINVSGSLFQSITISPDSCTLAAVSRDGPVTLWNLKTLREIYTLPGSRFAAFSPDGKTLATAGRQSSERERFRNVALWNLATHHETTLRSWATGLASVNCVGFSPDGKRLAAGLDDGQMRVWDVATGRALAAPAGHSSWIYSIAYSPNGRLLASASTDCSMRLWDPQSGRALGTLRGHDSEIASMAFSSDGTLLVSASTDKVKLWSVTTDSLRSLDQDARSWPSNDGRVEAFDGPSPGTLTLRDSDTELVVGHITASMEGQILVGLSNSTHKLYTIRYDRKTGGSVDEWDTSKSRISARKSFGPGGYAPEFCDLNPDGTLLSVSDWTDGPVQFFNLPTLSGARTIEGDRAAFSPDGRLVAVGGWSNIRIYDVATWREVGQPIKLGVTGMVFSPDSHRLLIGSSDGSIHVFDLNSRAMVKVFKAHSASIRAVAISPDGQTLVTDAGAPTLKLWNTRTWRQTLTLHVAGPSRAWFSPNGRTLYMRALSSFTHAFRAPQPIDMPPAIGR